MWCNGCDFLKGNSDITLCLSGFTFEGGGYRLGGAESVRVRERALAGVTDGLYSEAVAAGLSQSLDLVGVAGAVVDRHEPGQRRI